MAGFHEPSSRIFANCVSDGATVFLWGGSGGVISNKEVDWFQISSVTWRKIETGGQHPLPGLSDGASSHSGQYLYTYGGRTGPESTDLHGSLYALDTTSYNWKQLSMCTPESPLKKSGCGMVVHGQELVVFGGRCGQQTGPVQPGSKHHGEYCNEMHWFNLKTGSWSSPRVTGVSPPPCAFFSFTLLNTNLAVLMGGYQPGARSGAGGYVSEVFVLDLGSKHWTQLTHRSGEPWPVERQGHAAVCLGFEMDHPQVLVMGGMDRNGEVCSDMWLLDVVSGRWSEVSVPIGGVVTRVWHSAAAMPYDPDFTEVILFGGSRDVLLENVVAETSLFKFVYSAQERTWVLQEMADHHTIGSSGRISEKKSEENISAQNSPNQSVAGPPPVTTEGNGMERMESERRLAESERRLAECERRLAESMRMARELRESGSATEKRLEARALAADERTAISERRMENLIRRAVDADRRLAQVEESLDESDQLVQQLSTQWVVQGSEIQRTGTLLGQGGWATVSVATFRGTLVAAKTIHRQILSQHNRQIFKREMNMAARIRHPNLAQFIGATLEGEMVILTELMPTSLRREVEREYMPPSQATTIGLDVARALNYLHLMEPVALIHRDISSANVLLQPLPLGRWKAKVTDYGSVNLVRQLKTENPGSPAYSAPEANNHQLQSAKMDIYSFGALVLEMLTGELPAPEQRKRLLRIIRHQQLLDLIRRCLSERRDDRPNAGDIITELNP